MSVMAAGHYIRVVSLYRLCELEEKIQSNQDQIQSKSLLNSVVITLLDWKKTKLLCLLFIANLEILV